MNRRLRRAASFASLTLLGAACAPLLAGCGGNGQIAVTMAYTAAKDTGQFKAGDTAQFTVTVRNQGPGDAPGVTVGVDMPSTFHYRSTDDISPSGAARTQPLDARVGSGNPQWGFWDLASPSVSGGKTVYGSVRITFTVQVLALPNTYELTARAQGDNTAGNVQGKPLAVRVVPAPTLGVVAKVDPTSVRGLGVVTYSLTVNNTGSGEADNVSVLIALPTVVAFQSTVTPFGGNASENNVIQPQRGAVEVFYSGFTLPSASGGGPGYVTITFKAVVASRPVSGTYAMNAQVTDSVGDTAYLKNAAALTISGIDATPGPAVSASPG